MAITAQEHTDLKLGDLSVQLVCTIWPSAVTVCLAARLAP
jgi:hypothetical protein